MMSKELLSLRLEEFFNSCNWQGKELLAIDRTEEVDRSINWQCLSIQKFFQDANWQGLSLEEISKDRQTISQSSYQTLSVREFFYFLAWEGSPPIGVIPKLTPTNQQMTVPEKELDIAGLSELF